MVWRTLALLSLLVFLLFGDAHGNRLMAAQQTSPALTKEGVAELSDEQVRRLLLEKLSGETRQRTDGHGDDYHPAVIAFRLQRAFG